MEKLEQEARIPQEIDARLRPERSQVVSVFVMVLTLILLFSWLSWNGGRSAGQADGWNARGRHEEERLLELRRRDVEQWQPRINAYVDAANDARTWVKVWSDRATRCELGETGWRRPR